MEQEHVYIFDFGDRIKAGFSKNVPKRLRTVELASGIKVKQTYFIDAGRKEEKIFHSYLENRLEGEFFAFPFDKAKEILDKISNGTITTEKPNPNPKLKRKTSSAVKNKYNAKAYDRINLTVSKGKKEVIQSHAQAQGKSVNGFINEAIDEKMQRDNEKGAE